jgi:hypothetical protein
MRPFVYPGYIVRSIWRDADTILFIFAGSAAEIDPQACPIARSRVAEEVRSASQHDWRYYDAGPPRFSDLAYL